MGVRVWRGVRSPPLPTPPRVGLESGVAGILDVAEQLAAGLEALPAHRARHGRHGLRYKQALFFKSP